jgi:hypothetical protein
VSQKNAPPFEEAGVRTLWKAYCDDNPQVIDTFRKESVALRFDFRRWNREAHVLPNLAKQWMKLAIELALGAPREWSAVQVADIVRRA